MVPIHRDEPMGTRTVTRLSPGRISSEIRRPTLAADETTDAARDRIRLGAGSASMVQAVPKQ